MCGEECSREIELDWAHEHEANYQLEKWSYQTYCTEKCDGCAHVKDGVELIPRTCADDDESYCRWCDEHERERCTDCEPAVCDEDHQLHELPICDVMIRKRRQKLQAEAKENRRKIRKKLHKQRDQECSKCNRAMFRDEL